MLVLNWLPDMNYLMGLVGTYYEKCIIEHNIYLLFYFPESSFVINASPLEYSHSSHNHSFDHMTCFSDLTKNKDLTVGDYSRFFKISNAMLNKPSDRAMN